MSNLLRSVFAPEVALAVLHNTQELLFQRFPFEITLRLQNLGLNWWLSPHNHLDQIKKRLPLRLHPEVFHYHLLDLRFRYKLHESQRVTTITPIFIDVDVRDSLSSIARILRPKYYLWYTFMCFVFTFFS